MESMMTPLIHGKGYDVDVGYITICASWLTPALITQVLNGENRHTYQEVFVPTCPGFPLLVVETQQKLSARTHTHTHFLDACGWCAYRGFRGNAENRPTNQTSLETKPDRFFYGAFPSIITIVQQCRELHKFTLSHQPSVLHTVFLLWHRRIATSQAGKVTVTPHKQNKPLIFTPSFHDRSDSKSM